MMNLKDMAEFKRLANLANEYMTAGNKLAATQCIQKIAETLLVGGNFTTRYRAAKAAVTEYVTY